MVAVQHHASGLARLSEKQQEQRARQQAALAARLQRASVPSPAPAAYSPALPAPATNSTAGSLTVPSLGPGPSSLGGPSGSVRSTAVDTTPAGVGTATSSAGTAGSGAGAGAAPVPSILARIQAMRESLKL